MLKQFEEMAIKKQEYTETLKALESAIYENIDKMPDNPHIIINEKSFIISSKDLLSGERIWSVYSNDWKAQFEDIKRVVGSACTGNKTELQLIIEKQKVYHNEHIEKLHPAVFTAVKPILERLNNVLFNTELANIQINFQP